MYYIYHIPNKKIGVTQNLFKRLTVQQGYNEDQYEVLESSNDIDYISHEEIRLQKIYGYTIDRQLYKEKINNKTKTETMRITSSQATTTFDVPVNKLKANLFDNIGLQWTTADGKVNELTKDSCDWICRNIFDSQFSKEICYIYNIAYDIASEQGFSDNQKALDLEVKLEENIFDDIRLWAFERGIFNKGDVKTQYVKLQEESGEVARAIIKGDSAELKDGIGDMVVVLTNLAHLAGLEIEDCIKSAYDVINQRKGKMINGSFVKDETKETPINTTNNWKSITI